MIPVSSAAGRRMKFPEMPILAAEIQQASWLRRQKESKELTSFDFGGEIPEATRIPPPEGGKQVVAGGAVY